MNRLNRLQNIFKKIVIVRHGQSIWNHDSKFTGWTNIPLTHDGKKEAVSISKKLNEINIIPNIIFSSELDRCIKTSNIIINNMKNKNIPIHTSWRLNEKHYGTLEGVPREYIRRQYGEQFTSMMRGNFTFKPPVLNNVPTYNQNKYKIYRNCYFKTIEKGESKEDVLSRLLPYYENDILYKVSDENKLPLIVTHKHCARVLMKKFLNIDDDVFQEYQIPSKNIIIVSLDDELNYLSHELIPY